MDCIVCGKPIHVTGANICSTQCMIKSARGETKPGNRRPKVSPTATIGKMQQMLYAELPKEQEVPMLKIAHPWIKNRNVVQSGIVFSFGEDGVATVKELVGAREAIQILLKKQRGYFIPKETKGETKEAIVSDPPKATAPAPQPAPELPKAEEPAQAAPESKEAEEPAEEPKKRKGPPRRPVKKEPVQKDQE